MSRQTLALSTLIVTFIAPCFAQTRAGQRPATASHPVANLSQLMKGMVYPSSNVIFAAQTENPADVKPAADPAMATNPLASAYGKWQAVENGALAISEAASLLS